MKRGLVIMDPAETAPSEYEARLEALRDKLRAEGSTVGLVFGDVARSNDIQYLTNLCLYWNEAVLVVPVDGKPALITKLSKRVQPWMKRTSVLDDVRSGPQLAKNVTQFIKEVVGSIDGQVSLVDLDLWPNFLVNDLSENLPDADLKDLPNAIRSQRYALSNSEAGLLNEAKNKLNACLDQAWAQGKNDAQRIEIAVKETRSAGFLDVVVFCKSLEDGTVYIDAVGQYRYVWLRVARAEGGAMADLLNSVIAEVKSKLSTGICEEDLTALVKAQIGDKYQFSFSCMPLSDLESRGKFRLPGDGARLLKEGETVSVSLGLSDNNNVASVSEMVLVPCNSPQ